MLVMTLGNAITRHNTHLMGNLLYTVNTSQCCTVMFQHLSASLMLGTKSLPHSSML